MEDLFLAWVAGKIGKTHRKYKLDKLPQIVNVLEGDMSLVGPRPEVHHYVDMFAEEGKAVLSVPPGITDWASICNPDKGDNLTGSADPEKVYMKKIGPEKIRLQLKYVQKESFKTDLKIILETITIVLKRCFT